MKFKDYELVVGFETHIELSTKTKIFCSCMTEFGGEPNTKCCPVCIGLPGSLPVLNKRVVEFAIMAGIATGCKINNYIKMDRKNYSYPDLPKAYQITQNEYPLCYDGHISLDSGKKIKIKQIHIEEDAGKLTYSKGNVQIDYNRSGVPLIEIVSMPDMNSPEEACEYLNKLRCIIKHMGISDCKMQEGSFRCDVNISVKKHLSKTLGQKVEIKNLNSFSAIEKVINFEYKRQIQLIEQGIIPECETRRYNDLTGADDVTKPMRKKENYDDYRYFNEPDIPLIRIDDKNIEEIKNSMSENYLAKVARFVNQYDISLKDAEMIVNFNKIADFFEESIKGINNKQNAVNLLTTQIFQFATTELEKELFKINISSADFNKILRLLDDRVINYNIAKTILDKMLTEGCSFESCYNEADYKKVDVHQLDNICDLAILNNQKAVNDFLNGKQKAAKALVGDVMKISKGRADAVLAEKIIKRKLNKT